ncbi:RodZ domain-containing protein [Parasphingorhabdus sp.]|uniref:helix-turn-helix domain-containing protein n=1 Tax=Parasphingorhabdus sp. TaxID=2709688 RepID=UPI0032637E5B
MAEDTEENTGDGAELSLHSAGELLRQAREQKNLSIEEVAKTTRIPQRHLSSIEVGDFDALPGRTYAIGFGKSYARAVGLSDATIGTQLREEMDNQGHAAYQPETSGYSPANPSSIPPRTLALVAAGLGGVILVGYVIWRTVILQPADFDDISGPTEFAEDNTAEVREDGNAQTVGGTQPSATGTVVLTATETVWLKIYDENGERMFEKEMAAGETYTVPADAAGPQILTGRPDALTVTIDGNVVPALGTAERTIKDVGISAAALVARANTSSTDTGDQSDSANPGSTSNE